MLKKYRKIILAAVALVGAVTAVVFPDMVIPDQESVEWILTAIEDVVTSSE